MRLFRRLAIAWVALLVSGCPGDDPAIEPLFEASYTSTFREVRPCRRSGDHDLAFVKVWADPTAFEAYTTRAMPFPDGSVIVKEEFADDACTSLSGWTVMRREAGLDPEGGDWHWQSVDPDRRVSADGLVQRCRSCHMGCGVAPDGHDGTCSVIEE